MTIQDTINEMFHKLIRSAPLDVVVMFLRKVHPDMSDNEIQNALNLACMSYQMNFDKVNKTVSMYKAPEVPEKSKKETTLAFRVAVELLPEDSMNIMRVGFPFSYLVINNNKLYEVTFIPAGDETVMSLAIKRVPVPEEDREYIRRIAVVASTANLDCIQRVGFSRIARVTDDNTIEILEQREQDEAWLDMDD